MRFPWSKPTQAKQSESRAKADGPAAARPDAMIRPEDYVGNDQARNEQFVREGFAAKAKQYLRRLPMAEEVVALYFCLLDSKTPMWVKAIAGAALAYFILPLDAVPDILPMIGLGDDLSVLSAALATVSTNLTAEHRARARAWLEHQDWKVDAAGAR